MKLEVIKRKNRNDFVIKINGELYCKKDTQLIVFEEFEYESADNIMATQLAMAEQQLYGWHCSMKGDSLIKMVEAMGLTKREWKKLQDTNLIGYLSKAEIFEINEYFNKKDN